MLRHEIGELTLQTPATCYRAPLLQAIREALRTVDNPNNLAMRYGLRRFLRVKAPELHALSLMAGSSLAAAYPFIVIRGLPFIDFEEKIRDALLVAFLSFIGHPTTTDKAGDVVVWPVTPRDKMDYTTRTITERVGPAEPHTDSAYALAPERLVALLCVRPASDGGLTEIIDGRQMVDTLLARRRGRECYDSLRRLDYPIRVPTAFTAARTDDQAEWIVAKLVSRFLRFRYDQILSGFLCAPDYATAPRIWALNYFNDHVRACQKYVLSLNPGDLLIVDNFAALHGRTDFRDPSRLLLRVRLTGEQPRDSAANHLPNPPFSRHRPN
jgi:hypothetical protein